MDKNFIELSGVVTSGVLRNYKFEFKNGINIITGKNGSGKTTLLKCICYLRKYIGNIYLDKKLVKKNVCSFYFSGDDLGEEEMTIKDNIFYYTRICKDDIRSYRELLQCLFLEEYENTILKNASEGMKQKMRLIICILRKAKIIVLDEPFNYLDEQSKTNFIDYIDRKLKEEKNIYVIATNELNNLSVSYHVI